MPFTSFPTDFSTLPTVAVVVPNQNHDMHDGTIKQADTWLQQNLDPYVQWAKTYNSLLIVTWDEDDSSQKNQIVTIFTGQMVKPGRYEEKIDHYSVLRTIEEMYGLPSAGKSADVDPIVDVWMP
jgi:acid phosphatase